MIDRDKARQVLRDFGVITDPPMDTAVERMLTRLDASEVPQFCLTPEETVIVQDWYYSASDDFIPDNRDRELVRRLGSFAHVHGMEDS